MAISQLLGGIPPADFLTNHYLKLPFGMAGTATALCELGTWRVLDSILARPAADLMLARQGQPWQGKRPQAIDEVRALFQQGYTVLVRHAEQVDSQIAELAGSFSSDFRAPVDVHLYYTPASRHGFGWHYDVEDVFIVQTAGVKQYSLRKNTVNPWPVLETMPANQAFEREIMPVTSCRLAAGDWLYIPAGYWHLAQAIEDSTSLAIGLMMPTALDVLDALRQQLAHSLRWRQRLPVTGAAAGDAEAVAAHYRQLLGELATDLRESLSDDKFLRAFMSTAKRL